MSTAHVNYFEFFALPVQFGIDMQQFEANYRKIQSASHPDRFINAAASERMAAMQQATLANEAYVTLKNPASRAKYLLELHGIDAVADTNTALPMDFLMQQMEWRENLEDAKQARDIPALESLYKALRQDAKSLQASLADLFDTQNNYISATEEARKLIFIDKVCADIQQAIEHLD